MLPASKTASPLIKAPNVSSPAILRPVETPPGTVRSTDGNWVVAYGYTDRQEFNDLMRVLSGHGSIRQQHSNGNWLAVQYDNTLSAEKALCCQPIRLANSPSLCGTVRANSQLLQSLLSQPPSSSNAEPKGFLTAAPKLDSNSPRKKMFHEAQRNQSLEEEDILAHYDDYDTTRQAPTSVCEKLFAWYFGWSYETPHPHSD